MGDLAKRLEVERLRAMKQVIVGTMLGRVAMSARSIFDVVRAPLADVGTVANDQLANYFVTRLCQEGRAFIDVGAHIGSIIADVSRYCPRSQIIAVEAIPEKASKLRGKFPNAKVHCFAASNTEGETSFFIDVENSGYSSLANNGGAVQEIRVSVRRLDSVLADTDVGLMKIDVEGAELGVLRGSEAIIARSRPLIMFESGPNNVLGHTKEQMFAWFAAQDYGLFVPNRLAHTASSMRLDVFLDSHEYPRRTTNYFAVPSDRTEEIRKKAGVLLEKGVLCGPP